MPIAWQKDVPEEVQAVIRHNNGRDTVDTYRDLQREVAPLTSLRVIRSLARKYSKKYHVPIRISASAVEEDVPDGEAMFRYHYDNKGRIVGQIFLHPVLQYYPASYVEGVILHELDHLEVERRWSKVL